MPWKVFQEKVLALYTVPLRAPATYRAMRSALANLERITALVSSQELTTDLLARFIARRSTEVSINSVRGELAYLSSACTFAVEEGCLGRTPFASRRLRLRPQRSALKRHLTLREVAGVLRHLRREASSGGWSERRLFSLFATVAYTGLRRNEALFLQRQDVRLSGGYLDVVARGSSRLKTESAAAPVPIPSELAEVLAAWIPACGSEWLFPTRNGLSPWTGGAPGTKPLERIREAGRDAGVEGVTFQALRHSWATHAESAWGIPEAAIQRVLRHTTPFTQAHYRHADLANLRAIGQRVTYAPPTSPRASCAS